MDAHRQAWARALAGDYLPAERLLDGEPADGWREALRAVCWMAAPDALSAPEPPVDGDPDARAIVLAQRARRALLEMDWRAHASFAPAASDATGLAADLADEHAALRALAEGDAAGALGRFDTLRKRSDAASVVADAAAWAALAALAAGDREDAVARARRASRIARTEGLLQSEYLANLVLARVRRHAGAPHLATRILEQLSAVAPAPWQPWLAYERALAGGRDAALGALFDAARVGDRAAFDGAREARLRRARGFAPFEAEMHAIVSALDPHAPPHSAFERGADALSPHGVVDPAEDEGPVAHVWLAKGDAMRILDAGRGFTERAAWAPTDLREQRSLTLLSVLALEGPMELDDAFAAVYGFAFTSAKHDAVMRTLLHRARSLLGDAGEIERDGYRLTLRAHRPLLVPDPRCARPAEQRILSALATGSGGAREIAQRVRVPLRTVQLALKQLVDDGAARVEKDGRRVHYVVEDTTFAEPTLSRLRRRPAQPG